jgi:peptidoglycan/xylan/chitin deacetylase (PgdA/CDA1 family)
MNQKRLYLSLLICTIIALPIFHIIFNESPHVPQSPVTPPIPSNSVAPPIPTQYPVSNSSVQPSPLSTTPFVIPSNPVMPSTSIQISIPTRALISGFEDLNEWIAKSGEVKKNTDLYVEGKGALTLTSTNGTRTEIWKSVNIDFTGRHPEFQIHVDNTSNLSSLSIYIESENNSSKSFSIGWVGTSGSIYIIYSGWNTLGLSRANFDYSAGAADDSNWKTITKIRFVINSKASTTVNVTLDALYAVRDLYQGLITLRFDDSYYNDTYTVAKPIMDQYGFRGVLACTVNQVGGLTGLTVSQLQELQNSGWDIVSHSMTHSNFSALSVDSLEYEIKNSQDWLKENGFEKGSRFLVPPNGECNDTVLPVIKKYYYASQVLSPLTDTLPPSDTFRMMSRGVGSQTNLNTVKSWIDSAQSNGAWLTLLFHRTVGMQANFFQILEYIRDSGIQVVTFSDVFDEILAGYSP